MEIGIGDMQSAPPACVCVFLADILLIQCNIGTPADLLVLCPGGQPKTERKREKEGERLRQGESERHSK